MPNRKALADRVVKAAETALAAQGYASPIDVLAGVGWIDLGTVERWRRGQIDCIESGVQTNPPRILEALKLFQSWATERGLSPNQADYVARTPQRQALRFSRSGDPAIEARYRTHWVSPELPEKKRNRLIEEASRAPELVVVQPLKSDWTCHRCGGSGDFLMMENPGPVCLRCMGLDDLEFLPAGDALLSRRVKAKSTRSPSSSVSVEAVVATKDKACWSSRKHYRTCNVNLKRSGVAIRRDNSANRSGPMRSSPQFVDAHSFHSQPKS